SRPDGFVRFLRVLRLCLVDARLLGHLAAAIEPPGDFANLLDRLSRERDGVSAHVRYEADVALTEIDALVELLREPHGAPGVEAELAGGLLLQSRGGERRGWCAAPLFAIHRDDAQLAQPVGHGSAVATLVHRLAGCLLDVAFDVARLRLVREGELLYLLAGVFGELQRERRR